MKSTLFLDVIIGEGATIFKLLSRKDKTLLIRRNTKGDQFIYCHPDSQYLPFFILNLGLNVVDSVRGFYFQGDSLAGQRLNKNLHSSTETEDKVKGGFFLNVIVGKGATIFKLLSCKDKTLLVRRNTEEDQATCCHPGS